MPAPLPSHGRRVLDGIDVWIVRTSAVRADALDRCRDLLARDELAACARFRRDEDRVRALVARALVRTTLSRYEDVAPTEWRFVAGPYGKPEIAAPAGTALRFNVSHACGVVVCAVARGADVGVDVERFETTRGLSDVAAQICSAGELAALRSAPGDEFRDRLLALWTLKEAYLKARGVGLSLDPRLVEFDLVADGGLAVSFRPDVADDSRAWWFAVLDVGESRRLSVAVAGADAASRLALFETSPCGGAEAGASTRVVRESGSTRRRRDRAFVGI